MGREPWGDQNDGRNSTTSGDDHSNGDQALIDGHFGLLARWTAIAVLALLVCVLGAVVLAWCVSKGNGPEGDCTAKGDACNEEHHRSASSHRPPSPAPDDSDMILVVNVTGGAAYQQVLPATPPACQECPQSLTVTGAGGGGRDLIVVVDKKKVVEQLDKETTVKTEKLEKVETKQVVKQPASPDPPEVCKQPVGRVRFEPGRFLVRFQRQDVLDIADLIQGRSGTVLVVGRPELGRGTRQARRRAKKVGKALRDALKGRDGTQLPVLTQAASTDQPGTAETEACAGSHYGTAAVYLIEGLP